MSKLQVVGTWSLGPSEFRGHVQDMEVVTTASGAVLYATNGALGGVVSYRVESANGRLRLLDTHRPPDAIGLEAPAELSVLTLDGDQHIASLGRIGGPVPVFTVSGTGALDGSAALEGITGADISTLTAHQAATRSVVYAAYWGRSDIGIYQVNGDRLDYLGQVSSPVKTHGADLVDFQVTEVGGQDLLLFASRYQDTVFSYRINQNGGLAVADVIRASDGLPVATPSALEVVSVGGSRFAVLASAGTSSLTVMGINAAGKLKPLDHVYGDQHTRMQGVVAMDTISIGGRGFVVTGGANDGVSLFEVLPGGRLYHRDAQEDLLSTALQNVTAVKIVARGNGFDIYASSETEPGITQLRYDLGAPGRVIRGTASNDRLNGTDGDDVIAGGAGNDIISGGAGADIILDGPGSDRMTGGAGADIYVIRAGKESDYITDFDPSEDRLDLSGLGRVYDVSGLSWAPRRAGAVIKYGEKALIIQTSDSTPLPADHFLPHEVFNLAHNDLSYMDGRIDPAHDPTRIGTFEGSAGSDTLTGTERNDVIRGHAGHDILSSGSGDDTLNGGPGADTLDGGSGRDWLSYEGSRGSLRVDLMFPQINTNVAAGDRYASIENLIGSQGFDNLRGTLGNNVIRGERNVDYIFGRRGADTLEGGIGDDVLFGGLGPDVLRGGANRDRAQFSEALTSVRVDLLYPSRNTGEAKGDVFDSIEDLAGGRFADHLSGDRGNNRLFGREGADTLIAREGDDYLNGGAHGDRLDGGPGNDTLRGGQHADVFVFTEGADVIEDFNHREDRIALDRSLLGGGPHDGERAMDFAHVVDGSVIFMFDTGDQLVLQNITSLSGLADTIDFL